MILLEMLITNLFFGYNFNLNQLFKIYFYLQYLHYTLFFLFFLKLIIYNNVIISEQKKQIGYTK